MFIVDDGDRRGGKKVRERPVLYKRGSCSAIKERIEEKSITLSREGDSIEPWALLTA